MFICNAVMYLCILEMYVLSRNQSETGREVLGDIVTLDLTMTLRALTGDKQHVAVPCQNP